MLLNAQGKDVTKQIEALEHHNPKVYRKNRFEILGALKEALCPRHHHQGDMFSIGARAVLK
jgi:hypothetical protein